MSCSEDPAGCPESHQSTGKANRAVRSVRSPTWPLFAATVTRGESDHAEDLATTAVQAPVTAYMGRSFYDLLQTISLLSFQPVPLAHQDSNDRCPAATSNLRHSATPTSYLQPAPTRASDAEIDQTRETRANAAEPPLRRASVWTLPAGSTPAAEDVEGLRAISATLSRRFEREGVATRHRQPSETVPDQKPRSPPAADSCSRGRSQCAAQLKLSPLPPLADASCSVDLLAPRPLLGPSSKLLHDVRNYTCMDGLPEGA